MASGYGQPPPKSIIDTLNPSYYSAAYGQVRPSAPSVPPASEYENSYDNSVKFDHGGGSYLDEKFGGGYNSSIPDMGSDFYGKQSVSYSRYGDGAGYDDGVYAYKGGQVEPYGARGTAPNSSTYVQFDDYGRPINFPSGKDSSSVPDSASAKMVKAVPKAETQQDVKSGV
ncbi:hypothetical protein F3Y22_tig00002840pilonHSYRG01239 [Hibiscus syriacus]|uniref:Uncharacterized protein n=1 Tax=Hibiscus syriacus TaxID=106335 RepID=A0A6A3CW34_HIBSY|nr:hypothetical protein F3Y22_tig00002840pilonHSYRG01239 [Hibiscus syriacus]